MLITKFLSQSHQEQFIYAIQDKSQTCNMRAIKSSQSRFNQASKHTSNQASIQSILNNSICDNPSTHDLEPNVDERLRGYTMKNEAMLFILSPLESTLTRYKPSMEILLTSMRKRHQGLEENLNLWTS